VANDLIKISATGVAEFITANPSSRPSKLRPYKFNKRGEGFGRSSYYQAAINCIKKYHSAGRDENVTKKAMLELTAISTDESLGKLLQVKAQRNIDAILAYMRVYGARRFQVLKNHRLSYTNKKLRITASPDIWVKEADQEVLLKIGAARHRNPDEFVELLLHLIRKAAISSGYKVRAKNVVYLDISIGQERVAQKSLSFYNKALDWAAKEIAAEWSNLAAPPGYPAVANTKS
jgi:hypothetical protein